MKQRLKKLLELCTLHRCEAKPIFSKLGLLNFGKLYELEVAKLMYDVNNNDITWNICELFQKTKTSHSYKTRQATANKFSYPIVTTECRKKIITFKSIKTWNQIPQEISSMSNKELFNRCINKWLLQN